MKLPKTILFLALFPAILLASCETFLNKTEFEVKPVQKKSKAYNPHLPSNQNDDEFSINWKTTHKWD